MSRRRPTLQWCRPSLSMGRLSTPPTNGAGASYRSHARHPWSGLAARWLICLFGVPKRDASKNREMDGALDLDGRRLMMAYNNQPRIGGRDNGDVRAEARGRESAWGDTVPSFGVSNWATKKIKHEIHHDLRQPLINNGSHNNQPKTGSRNGEKHGGEVQRAGGVGEARYHHFGGIVNWITGTNWYKL
jgi:hypothetical protein